MGYIKEFDNTQDTEIIPYITKNFNGDYVVAVDDSGNPTKVLSQSFYEEVEFSKYGDYSEGEGDAVQHPSHYTHGKYETIDVIEDVTSGYDDGYIAYCVGNAVKYLYRAPFKHESPLEDLRKAEKYIEFAVNRETKRSDSLGEK